MIGPPGDDPPVPHLFVAVLFIIEVVAVALLYLNIGA